MTNRIKAVIFDFGQVLSLPPAEETIQSMCEICNMDKKTFNYEYRKNRDDYDRGTIDGVAYWSSILRVSNISPDEATIKSLIRKDIECWTVIDHRIVDWALSLKHRGYKIGILSNMPEDLIIYIKDSFSWIQTFDTAIFSCNYGVVKPEASIYYHCMKALKATAGECLFIDDTKVNSDAAKKLGMNALQYESLQEAKDILS